MSNQVSANRGVPAEKLPSVKEPGDPARPEVRGPAGAGEGRRGGTGDGGRGETGAAGSEEGRHRSKKVRPEDPDPGDALRGDGEGNRIVGEESQVGRRGEERVRPEDPEPGEEMRYLRGDGEGNRVRGEERQVGRSCKPTGIGWWRLEQELDRSHLKSTVGESLGGEVSREVTPPNASEAVEKLRSSFGQQCPPAISGMRSGQNVIVSEGFFSPSVHFVEKQESPTFSSQQIRKPVPVSSAERPEDRFVKASDLVNKVNKLSRQKRGGYFDISGLEFSENCPLCELECQCLGPSCLQKKGISDIFRYKQSLQPKMIFCTGVSEVKVRSAPVTDRLPRLASKTYCTNPVLPDQRKRCV